MIIWEGGYNSIAIETYKIIFRRDRFMILWTNENGMTGYSAHQNFMDNRGPKETIKMLLETI